MLSEPPAMMSRIRFDFRLAKELDKCGVRFIELKVKKGNNGKDYRSK